VAQPSLTTDLLSVLRPGSIHYRTSAWSFSAPFVSGAAALLLNVSASFNESSAERSLAHAVWITPDLGNGRLDLYQAVSALRTSDPN
jgi:hypothetical protein